jgi:hypothetical protein
MRCALAETKMRTAERISDSRAKKRNGTVLKCLLATGRLHSGLGLSRHSGVTANVEEREWFVHRVRLLGGRLAWMGPSEAPLQDSRIRTGATRFQASNLSALYGNHKHCKSARVAHLDVGVFLVQTISATSTRRRLSFPYPIRAEPVLAPFLHVLSIPEHSAPEGLDIHVSHRQEDLYKPWALKIARNLLSIAPSLKL